MAHVLIGFAEALPAPEVVFSLLDSGHRISAFSRTPDLPLARLPLRKLHVISSPEQDAPASVSALRTLMENPDAPDIILPLDDAGLWLVNEALGDDPRIAGATGDQAGIALDKRRQIAAAQEAGMAVPPTHILNHPRDFPEDIALPSIVKPALAVMVKEGMLVKSAPSYMTTGADVEAAKAAAASGPALLQPLIAGVGEGVFGFADKTGVVCWSGHRRVRMMNPHGSGSSACIAVQPDPDIQRAAARFIANIGWRGAFMLEFLRGADGTLWFMELNGRMWGSLALARRQGLEYPSWAVSQSENPGYSPPPPPPPDHPLVVRNLGRELLHLMFVLRGPKSDFHRQRWPRFRTSLIQVLKPSSRDSFYNYDPAYRSFFLHDAIWTIRRMLKR